MPIRCRPRATCGRAPPRSSTPRPHRPIAASVGWIELGGLPEKGNVSDWIAGRRADGMDDAAIGAELRALVRAASPAQPPAWPPGTPGSDQVALVSQYGVIIGVN